MKNSFILLILFAAVTFSACKKYPEGGYINGLRNPEKRVTDFYRLDGFKVNGVDSSLTGSQNSCPVTQINFINNEYAGRTVELINNCAGVYVFPTNSWALINNNKQLVITCTITPTANITFYPLVINQNITVTWDIERLTKNDLWLRTMLYGREYYLKLTYPK